MTWKVDTVPYFHERAISTQQTGFFFVSQSRSWLPDAVGGIHWFGVDDTYSSVYTPFYSSITAIPHCYEVGNGSIMEYSDDAAFWVFNQVSNFAYTRYNAMIPEILAKQKELETKYIASSGVSDAVAAELFKKDPAMAVAYLTDYSKDQAHNTVKTWKSLYRYLFTKYLDGNIKTKDGDKPYPKVNQPGYSAEWYRKIAEMTGDRFKVPQTKK
jgi:dipeptidase